MNRWATIVLVNLLLLEALSALLVYAVGRRRPHLRRDLHIEHVISRVDTAMVTAFRTSGLDAELGWESPAGERREGVGPGGPWVATFQADGRRAHPGGSDQMSILTFGDSFTMGADVNDDETWPYFLEQELGVGVWNFGVGGYGLDQAVAKMKETLETGAQPAVIALGVYEADLGRALSAYRPFFYRESEILLGFKPHCRVEDGRVVIVPNPWSAVHTIDDVRPLVLELARDDYWLRSRGLVDYRFPLSLQAMKIARWGLRRAAGTAVDPNPWDEADGRLVAHHLLGEVLSAADAVGALPVFVFIPGASRFAKGIEPDYASFLREGRAGALSGVAVVDVHDVSIDPARLFVAPSRGHLSAHGNRHVAAMVATAIRRHPAGN